MIDLNKTHANIHIIAGLWKSELYDFLFKTGKDRIFQVKDGYHVVSEHRTYYARMSGTVAFWYNKKTINQKERKWLLDMLSTYEEDFMNITEAGENEMKSYIQDYIKKSAYTTDNAKSLLQTLFVKLYSTFTTEKDDNGITRAHRFLKMLNVKTCPYCNRNYTFTIDEKNARTAPEYDHFYDKSDYPLLAVAFYNLVPSCHTCNHVKGTKKTVKINPFFSGFESKFILVDENGKELTKAEIFKKKGGQLDFKKPTNANRAAEEEGNIEAFGLRGLYRQHDDYVGDIIGKVMEYDAIARQALVEAFQSNAKSPQQVYDFVWGSFLDIAQNGKRPLSKLTREILEQLEIKR